MTMTNWMKIDWLKSYWGYILFGVSSVAAFWSVYDWWTILGVVAMVEMIAWKVETSYLSKNTALKQVEEEFESFRTFVEGEFTKYGTVIEEQDTVIKDYEGIFDSQLGDVECVCGQNTFQGLFSSKEENYVECEKCKNSYRVTVVYDTVLLSGNHNLE